MHHISILSTSIMSSSQAISVTSSTLLIIAVHHINSAVTLLISHLVHLLIATQQPLFINPSSQVCSSTLAYQPLLITLHYCCCHQFVLFYSLVTQYFFRIVLQIAYCLCNIVNALGHHPIMSSCHCLYCILGCIITHHCSLIHAKVSSVKPVYVCCCTSGQFAMAGKDFKPELSLWVCNLIQDCLCASIL